MKISIGQCGVINLNLLEIGAKLVVFSLSVCSIFSFLTLDVEGCGSAKLTGSTFGAIACLVLLPKTSNLLLSVAGGMSSSESTRSITSPETMCEVHKLENQMISK